MDEFELAIGGRSDEDVRVEAWRHQFALELGYSPELAELLAGSPADLHDLERLIRAGCSLSLAARIV